MHDGGLLLQGNDGKQVNVKFISLAGKYMQAARFGQAGQDQEKLVLDEEEGKVSIRVLYVRTYCIKVYPVTQN